MASKGYVAINAVGLRSAGSKDQQTGVQYGGRYYPAHYLNGKLYSARFETTCFINRPNFLDAAGVQREVDNLRLVIVAWNGRNAKPGKGLADIFAKGCSPGKEFHGTLGLRMFQKRVWDNNKPMVRADGTEVLVDGFNFTIAGEFGWGNDAANQLAIEIASFDGVNPFSGRPQYWNVPGSQDAATWDQVRTARSACIHTTEPVFGYAQVLLPAGATLASAGQPQGQVAQPNQGTFNQQPVQQQPLVQQPLVQQQTTLVQPQTVDGAMPLANTMPVQTAPLTNMQQPVQQQQQQQQQFIDPNAGNTQQTII